MDEVPEPDEASEQTQVINGDDATLAEDQVSNVARTHTNSTEQADAASFLKSLLPPDPNTRRRVVTALLRAVLADRKIT